MTKILKTLNDEDHAHESNLEEEQLECFPVMVFEVNSLREAVPKGFTSVKIILDGGLKADLSWKREREVALDYIKQGYSILWEMDLGFSSPTMSPLDNRTQFLALTLSLEHFLKTLWKDFQKNSLGLNLYRGSLNFSKNFLWNEVQLLNLQEWIKDQYGDLETFVHETMIKMTSFDQLTPQHFDHPLLSDLLKLFCRDAMSEYLHLLAMTLPDHLPLFLMLDSSQMDDEFVIAQLLIKERFQRFHLAVKFTQSSLPKLQILGGELGWETEGMEKGFISKNFSILEIKEKPTLGFCLPRLGIFRSALILKLKEAFSFLCLYHIPFRVIPENDLALEWTNLNHLIVDTNYVNFEFKRKLQGFCAAGGTVVFLDKRLGFANELSFEDFSLSLN